MLTSRLPANSWGAVVLVCAGGKRADMDKGTEIMAMAAESANQDVTVMLRDAIVAVEAASASGREATSKIEEQANHPELKELMRQGSKYSETWRERLAAAAEKVGGRSPAVDGNPIIDAIQQVGGKIIQQAKDPVARDLGIIASGQLALHYYISAFGTMAAYAKMLGLTEVAQSLHECLEEAKRGDERYTEFAEKIGG